MMTASRRILMAAVVATFSATVPSMAQYPVANDGRALDANPRIGSGGYNTGNIPDPASQLMMQNKIVTGNVTGGKYFRGGIQTTDPQEFRGQSASWSMDRFIRDSAGVPGWQQPLAPPGTAQPFYGGQLANPMSPQFSRNATGTFTTSAKKIDGPPEYDPRIGPIRIDSAISLPSGDMVVPGPVDPMTNQRTVYTVSPLMGLKAWRPSELADQKFLGDFASMRSRGALGSGVLEPNQIRQLQDELNQAVDTQGPAAPKDPNMARPVPQPFETPSPSIMRNTPLVNQIGGAALSNDIRQDVGSRVRPLAPPQQQTSQYAELEQRLSRYYGDIIKGNEAKFPNAARQLSKRGGGEKPLTPPGEGPQVGPTETAKPPVTDSTLPDYVQIGKEILGGTSPMAIPAQPQPFKIRSLAAGVRADGLARLIREGEGLMREGQFEGAMVRFEAAQQVASNNWLVTVGRANAALGAGYYKKAEAWLRMALENDPVLLMAQFDLAESFGQARLEAVVKDLKEAANAQPDDAGLAMLLSYIAYNTGNSEQAGVYLDLAEKRSGGKDDFYRTVRSHWRVPSTLHAEFEPFELSEMIKHLEDANIATLKQEGQTLLGTFRKPVVVPGKLQGITRFKCELPRGAERGPFLKWLREHANGAELTLD